MKIHQKSYGNISFQKLHWIDNEQTQDALIRLKEDTNQSEKLSFHTVYNQLEQIKAMKDDVYISCNMSLPDTQDSRELFSMTAYDKNGNVLNEFLQCVKSNTALSQELKYFANIVQQSLNKENEKEQQAAHKKALHNQAKIIITRAMKFLSDD